jgi:hypothetical protein
MLINIPPELYLILHSQKLKNTLELREHHSQHHQPRTILKQNLLHIIHSLRRGHLLHKHLHSPTLRPIPDPPIPKRRKHHIPILRVHHQMYSDRVIELLTVRLVVVLAGDVDL